ncbi:MAG: hypothetical protein ACXWXQ_10310 [Actinomycetota bacterium]
MSLTMKLLGSWALLSVPLAMVVGRFLRAADRPAIARIRPDLSRFGTSEDIGHRRAAG